ncbi:hypothetical protein, partial [Micromonospora sp. NPDC047074]|uniref:hypothetical protein n=1 Tax=Micromonospora sp. NPDC047074 TaxID=3154339 RepID=UPI0033D2BDC4
SWLVIFFVAVVAPELVSRDLHSGVGRGRAPRGGLGRLRRRCPGGSRRRGGRRLPGDARRRVCGGGRLDPGR